MIEETNDDIQENEAEMDHSEFEHSEISEETDVTDVIESSPAPLNSTEFETKLKEFFTKHKVTKLKFVPKIVKTFSEHEHEVLEHLHNKYVLGIRTPPKPKKTRIPVEDGSNGHSKKIEGGHSKKSDSSEAAPPKSKKKLVIIGIIVIVLGGLGGAAFMMKDKLMGAAAKASVEGEKKAEGEKPAAEPKKEAAPKAEVIDSTKKAPADAAKTMVKDSVKKP